MADVIALRYEAFTKTGAVQRKTIDFAALGEALYLFLFVKENNLIEGDKCRLTTTTFVDCNEATADVEHFSSDTESLTKY